jgi:hypothetical protein
MSAPLELVIKQEMITGRHVGVTVLRGDLIFAQNQTSAEPIINSRLSAPPLCCRIRSVGEAEAGQALEQPAKQ